MEIKRPRSRDKGEAKEGKGVFKRGSGTGQGPVGTGQGPQGIPKKENAERAVNQPKKEMAQGSAPNKGLDLGDILEAMGQSQQTGQQSGGQNSLYGNMTPAQQAHLQQQLAQQLNQQAQASQQVHQPQQPTNSHGQGPGGPQGGSTGGRTGGSRMGCLIAIVALVALFVIFSMMNKGNQAANNNTSGTSQSTSTSTSSSSSSADSSSTSNAGSSAGSTTAPSQNFGGLGSNASLFGQTGTTGTSINAANGYSTGWSLDSNNQGLDTNVASEAREKYTKILGNGEDTVTFLIYLCGTDLESNYSMATKDLQEMLAATRSDKVKIVLFTGGCSRWANNVMSNSVNEIYEILPEGLTRVSDNAGNSSMTNPDTLEAFIKWGATNYPANRMNLILWDHGGGSISGYGYDQRYKNTGAMSLTQINQALSNAGVKFDFIGFDACLMATAETALMASNYADYLIASEEVEPGIGWYYTNWLTDLCANTSMPTIELGQKIIDDYTERSRVECPGQDTTLSIVDLAELQKTLPVKLAAFANETNSLLEAGNYQTIAKARSSSQEFSRESKIDQIDFVHFANLLGTNSGKELIQTILSAVKYNRTSKGMTNAFGLSIYFPYRRLSGVDTMTQAYTTLGIDPSFAKCIRQFAQVQVSGQVSSGGNSSPLWSLLNSDGSGSWTSGSNYGSGYGSGYGSSYGGTLSESDLTGLLEALLGGSVSDYGSYGLFGLDRTNTRFLREDVLDTEVLTKYAMENALNADLFTWKENSEGFASIQLTEDQWSKISTVEMSMFYDDGEGYIDLGLDTVFDFDKDGNLLPVMDDSWVSIDGQPVAYYHLYTYESEDGSEYTIVGRVPVLYNDQRADLILVFDNETPSGYIAGVRYTYPEGDADTVAKAQESLEAGDKIDFLCDYYGYDGSFQDSYFIGDQYIVEDPSTIEIANTIIGDGIMVSYKFVDMFGETYWSPVLK